MHFSQKVVGVTLKSVQNVVGDFILGINSQFYNYNEAFDKKKSIFDQWSFKEFIYNV